MKEKIYQNWRIIIFIPLAIIFLILYSWYPYQTAKDTNFKFASPDETANYFWAKKFAAGQELQYFEPLNLAAQDTVIPRSMRSDNGVVKPVSFLGIILIYGALGKIFGPWIIIYLTPLFAIIGVVCFYGITRRIFNDKIALLSALMLFAFAPYWYYASRSMFHNVLFIDLLLIGIYLFINGTLIERMKRINTDFIFIFLSGVFIGLAIMTRASELIWLAPEMLIVWLAYFKQIGWRKLIVFICGIILVLLSMFYYNQILYGGPLKFGYIKNVESDNGNITEINNSQPPPGPLLTQGGGAKERTAVWNKLNKFLPAGIDIKQAGKSFIYYYIIIFWYLFWPAFFGGAWLLWNWKKIDNPQKLYLIVFIISSVILGLYYGSWKIQDNPNPASFTIGNSYTRYWLPMYIMSLPLASMFFLKFSGLIKNKYGQYVLLSALIILFILFNVQAAVWGKEEGLAFVKQNIISDGQRVREISALLEDNAIIVSERFDKFFWPEHKVIIGNLSDKSRPSAYAKLAEQGIPLYYYGFIFPPGDFAYLNSRKLAEVNLELEIIKLDEESRLGLYKLQVTSDK